MSLINKFKKASSKTPLEKISNEVTRDLERRLENSVNDFFTKALSKTGVSAGVSSILSARFGDALSNDLSDRYFRTSTVEQNRLTCEEIRDGVTPRYAETTSESIDRLENFAGAQGLSKDIYQFPSQIGKYYMTMKFREYTRTAPQAGATLKFKNAVVLPIPRRLEENFGLDINSSATGIFGAGADIIQTAFTENADANIVNSGATAAIAYSMVSNGLPGDIKNIIGSYLGSVPNPHMAVFFNGVDMRKFRFEWTFAPRNPRESEDLQNIIRVLKQNSLPAFSTMGTAILQYPYLCMIEMHPWAKDKDRELIKFKPALLTDISFNYSPNGIPSFFEGTNLPTFISISLEFIETEYFTSNDYGRSGRTDDKITDLYDKIVETFGVEDEIQAVNDSLNNLLGANTSG